MGEFSEQIKIDLLADFHNGMKISEIFAGIPFPAELKLPEEIPLFNLLLRNVVKWSGTL